MTFAPSPRRPIGMRMRAIALASIASVAPMLSDAAESEIDQKIKALMQRMQQLEQRNADLEKQVKELQSQPRPAAAAAAAPTGPQWGDRLQAVEQQQQVLRSEVQGLARPYEAEAGSDDGPKVEGAIVAVAQQVGAKGGVDGNGLAKRQSRASYRGDIAVELPAGFIGETRATGVGQLRFGQGGGVGLRPTYTGTVNSTTFEATAGSDDTYAVLVQAYVQFDMPLDNGRLNGQKGTRFEFDVGKMDFFAQFDQNAVAGDEAKQFLNNVFVHNPLLDSGGDIGADAFGFAPGLRAAYINEGDDSRWGVSIGAFASGGGANFDGGLGRPLTIAQLEYAPKQINGEPRGTYRVYAWTNGRTTDFDGVDQRHTGYGLSFDQRFGREWNLFGRWGQRTSGSAAFDKALTFGFEHGGRLWGRGRDAVGVAYGLLDTSSGWRGLTADGTLVGYAASGRERNLELYYRWKINDKLELSPDLQWIQRAGGDGSAPGFAVIGLRGLLGF